MVIKKKNVKLFTNKGSIMVHVIKRCEKHITAIYLHLKIL